MDGSITEDDQTRSIFTLLIYLNEAYKGGETEFYSGEGIFLFHFISFYLILGYFIFRNTNEIRREIQS